MKKISEITNEDVIVGQEIIYNVGCHKEMGRVDTFSAWSGIFEYIIVQPYNSNIKKTLKPNDFVELIDPRPKKYKLWGIFSR